MSSDVLLVLTTTPDAEVADRIAKALVEHRLAACVNVMPECRSIYRWKGAVEESREHLLVIKSTRANFAGLCAAVRDIHPYEVPELLSFPAENGLPAYMDWIREETLQDG
ncbi:MAG: divalent-cation tolerance protein CutA [Betaproteobacteria bacterium]|nr:divalent-cation tolerance protein CutA [Betaproteobacteria bacterium]MBL8533687.1 divalent-cation tolerance protein CutA [Betaproteobacteria bacterium]